MARNLMRLLEDRLAKEGIVNAIEIKRRAGRLSAPPTGDETSTQPRWADCLREWLQRFTQRGVKFIRLLRAPILLPCQLDEARARLRVIYARC